MWADQKGQSPKCCYIAFLDEQVITSGLPDPTQQDDRQALQSFSRQLGFAANSARSATQGQDYVAAILGGLPTLSSP